MELRPRKFDQPPGSFFLFGPRGTGKTTWLRARLADALFVNLLRPDVHRELIARPERLRELVRGERPETVVLDEVQRAPELLHVVHDLLEEPGSPRFVLTGSSARRLRREGVNLLAGRAVVRTMHPFIGAELPEFSLGSALETGLVPLVVASEDPSDTLSAYASLYLEQEVQAERIVRNVGDFARFLEVATFSHASVLNVSNIGRETGANRKTVESWIEILEDLLLAFRLPVFTRRAKRRTAAHPKFYYFDAGVYRSLRPHGPLDRPHEIEGAALEGLVAQHLRAWIAYGNDGHALHYWRTRAGTEVDFVVYGPRAFHAIEVKNAAAVRPADVRSLREFIRDYPEATATLLYRGEDRVEIGGIRCVPVEAYLRELDPAHGLPGSSTPR